MSLISSAEHPADGAAALSPLDIGPSPPANSTIGAATSSRRDIPDAGCTPTCANSQPIGYAPISDISPMPSSDHPLAKSSAPPTAKERALRTITCSGIGRALSSRSDLFGARLKIALARELQASTGYSMRWTRQTTPSGRSWWVLTTPAPTTDESVFGSLLPTPTASSYGSNRGGAAGRTGDLRPSLATMVGTMERNSRPLSETSGALGLTGTTESPVSQRRALLLGLVLWMMGQTPSWLQACATVASLPSGTRSSHKSRKRSATQS